MNDGLDGRDPLIQCHDLCVWSYSYSDEGKLHHIDVANRSLQCPGSTALEHLVVDGMKD